MNDKKLWFDAKYAYLQTEEGRIGKLLLKRSPRLARATNEELNDFRFMRDGIHWESIDEDIRFESFFEMPENTVAFKLGAIPDYISMSYIAQRYFGKSRSWLHNKLHGNMNNGKPSELTPQEKEQLQKALHSLSQEIEQAALQIT